MNQIPAAATLKELIQKAENNPLNPQDLQWLPPLIDHTLLKLEATPAQFQILCAEAKQFHFGAVCVRLEHVEFCVRELKGSGVKTVAVVGFPLGTDRTEEKVQEAKAAIQKGAQEIDMVLQVEFVKERKLREAFLDIQQVVEACGKIPVKVILETCLLTHDEKLLASALAKAAGAAFLKTSTGFSTGGATIEDIALLRSVAAHTMGVKASGGVRSTLDALKMILAGANRLGTSSGVNIMGHAKGPRSGVY